MAGAGFIACVHPCVVQRASFLQAQVIKAFFAIGLLTAEWVSDEQKESNQRLRISGASQHSTERLLQHAVEAAQIAQYRNQEAAGAEKAGRRKFRVREAGHRDIALTLLRHRSLGSLARHSFIRVPRISGE
jgi:hypothetical protein